MENFIVSARKYRPETFDSVVGQASITATLKSAIKKNQLGHAYLFCGPRGVGKTTCARIFAKSINCMNPGPEGEPCNTCESCLSFNDSRAFNIHELDAASNNSVEDIRNLTEQVRIPPQVGKYSVYIIDEVHMLSASAFNAFLKTLEEPPAHALFILATTEKHKIIPTILSRCQIFDFNRIRVEDIVEYMKIIAKKEGVKYEEDAFNLIALKAEGAMRDALSIFDQMVSFSGKTIRYQDVIENLNILDYEYYFRLTDACHSGQTGECLLIFDEILSKGFDAQNFLSGFSSHMRDLLVCKDEVTLQLLEVGAGIRERYKTQSREISQDWLYSTLDILGSADVSFKTSQNQRLHVELALLRLCHLREDTKKKALTREGDRPAETTPEAGTEPAGKPAAETVSKTTLEPTGKPFADVPSKPVPESGTGSTPGRKPASKTDPVPEDDSGRASETVIEPEPVPEDDSGTASEPGSVTPVEPDQEPASPGTPPRPARSVPGDLPSIKDALNGVDLTRKPDVPDGATAQAPVLSRPFSQEDLIRHWLAYADSIMGTRPRMANSLKHHLPALGDALQIELVLSNSAQLEEFNRDIKPHLVPYLEKALENNRFKLLPVIPESEEPEQSSLYTPEEKYDHMLKKNPDLGKLKERFNLDFE